MKPLLLCLLTAGAAQAQAPADTASSRVWHLGESVRTATDGLLSKPGWTLYASDATSRSFKSSDGKRRIVLGVQDEKVVQITLAGPIGSSIGKYVLKGATQTDSYHWQNAREHARITRSYTGEQEVYRVEMTN